MPQTDLAHRQAPWYREPLVWLLVSIPGSAVIMGIFAISLAVLSDDGLVADDYYKRGLEINRELARDRTATSYALSATLDLDSRAGTATARLTWNNGFTPPQTLQFNLYHATRSGLDTRLTLQRRTLNQYTGNYPTLSPGDYHLQLEADSWRLRGTVTGPFDGRLELTADAS